MNFAQFIPSTQASEAKGTIILLTSSVIAALWALFSGFFSRSGGNSKRKGAELAKFNYTYWMKSPLVKSEWLTSYIGYGSNVYLKLDVLQPAGSYKIRGISEYMKKQFSDNRGIDCFVTTSGGNAGVAVCYTAMKLSCKCIVIVDEAQQGKNSLLQVMEDQYSAEIQYYGKSIMEADEYAVKLCTPSGGNHRGNYCYVPGNDDQAIFKGNTSIMQELGEQYENGEGGPEDNFPDCIIVPVTSGDLLNGVLAGLYQLQWSRCCKVVAAESAGTQCFQSAVSNSYKPVSQKTVSCDGSDVGYGVITNTTAQFAEKFSKFNPIKSIIVRDSDILNVCTLFAEKQKIIIDPNGSGVALAAFYKNKQYFKQFKNVCIVVSGGNNTYFNKQLLIDSMEDGSFNEKPSEWMSSPNVVGFKGVDDEKEQEWLEDIDAYDSQSEEM